MNCIILRKEKPVYYIENCIINNNVFFGTNKRVIISKSLFNFIWTEEYLEIIGEDGPFIILNKELKDIIPAPEFNGESVGSREEVDKITEKRIRERYSSSDELKILRLKLSGDIASFEEYSSFVESIVQEGRNFKDRHFPKDSK